MMYFKRRSYSVYLCALLLPFYGIVIAEPKTEEEIIIKLILDIDNGNDSVCEDRRIEDKNIIPTNLEKVGYNINRQERWKLNRCGKVISYIVTFAIKLEINGGGNMLFVEPETEKMKEIVYVNNVAMRNNCDVVGKTKSYIHRVTKHRYYELNCKDKEKLIIECGTAYKDSGCWVR